MPHITSRLSLMLIVYVANTASLFLGFKAAALTLESESECPSAKHPYGEHVRRAGLGPRILPAGLSQPGAKTAACGTGNVLLPRKFPALLDNAVLHTHCVFLSRYPDSLQSSSLQYFSLSDFRCGLRGWLLPAQDFSARIPFLR